MVFNLDTIKILFMSPERILKRQWVWLYDKIIKLLERLHRYGLTSTTTRICTFEPDRTPTGSSTFVFLSSMIIFSLRLLFLREILFEQVWTIQNARIQILQRCGLKSCNGSKSLFQVSSSILESFPCKACAQKNFHCRKIKKTEIGWKIYDQPFLLFRLHFSALQQIAT